MVIYGRIPCSDVFQLQSSGPRSAGSSNLSICGDSRRRSTSAEPRWKSINARNPPPARSSRRRALPPPPRFIATFHLFTHQGTYNKKLVESGMSWTKQIKMVITTSGKFESYYWKKSQGKSFLLARAAVTFCLNYNANSEESNRSTTWK